MVFGFFKWGGEGAEEPIEEASKAEKEKKIIEPNKRQQDKLIASLLAGNCEAMSQDEVEVSADERDSFLMKLAAGEINQTNIETLLSTIRMPIKILYHQQAEALKMEAEERFGPQDENNPKE